MGVIEGLDKAIAAVIAHLAECPKCRDPKQPICQPGRRTWDELSQRHHARLLACVEVHRRKFGGPEGARVLIRSMQRIADVLAGRTKP